MSRRAKSSLLWGIVGTLLFLVLSQGYLLAGGDLPTGYFGMVVIGFLVGAVVAAASFAVEHRLTAKGRT